MMRCAALSLGTASQAASLRRKKSAGPAVHPVRIGRRPAFPDRRSMIQPVLRHFLLPLSLLLGLCVLTFFLSYVAPGDPARIILGPNAREDAVRELRVQMGFDRPLIAQFGRSEEHT